jgi:hypothetical protein
MATSRGFAPGTGILTTTGDGLDNAITTSRDAARHILVNAGGVPMVHHPAQRCGLHNETNWAVAVTIWRDDERMPASRGERWPRPQLRAGESRPAGPCWQNSPGNLLEIIKERPGRLQLNCKRVISFPAT